MLYFRHEPYGQQYPGQGPPSGQPPYGGHQPGMYPQQQVVEGKMAIFIIFVKKFTPGLCIHSKICLYSVCLLAQRSTEVLVKVTACMDKQCMCSCRKMYSLHWKNVNFNRCSVALGVHQVIVTS